MHELREKLFVGQRRCPTSAHYASLVGRSSPAGVSLSYSHVHKNVDTARSVVSSTTLCDFLPFDSQSRSRTIVRPATSLFLGEKKKLFCSINTLMIFNLLGIPRADRLPGLDDPALHLGDVFLPRHVMLKLCRDNFRFPYYML